MAQQQATGQSHSAKNHIEKVAIVGAGGHVGKFMTEALLKTGKHTVTAITRIDSDTEFPQGVQVKQIDYENPSSIVEALRGQDALLITLNGFASPDREPKLIEAGVAAGVPWIFPNEWSPDMDNESMSNDMLVGHAKRSNRELLTKLGKSSWIAVATGFWYEWSVAIPAAFGFDFEDRAVTLFDDGETRINTSTWPQVGRTMASLLSLKIHSEGEGDESVCLDRFRNGHVYVSSFTVSQKDILDSVMRVTKTTLTDWKVTREPAKERYAAAREALQKGDQMAAFVRAMYTRVFYPDDGGNVEKTRGLANNLLGLPKEDLDEYTAIAIKRAKEVPFGH